MDTESTNGGISPGEPALSHRAGAATAVASTSEASTGAEECPTCGPAAAPRPVYAIGKLEARFSTLASEKEFAQAIGRTEDTEGKTDQQVFYNALRKRENRYLARRLRWVLRVQGVETYIVVPRDPVDLDLLVEAIRPAPSPMDLDVVIGHLGRIAPPEMCNGLMAPIVDFEQLYSFDWKSLIKSVPRPKSINAEQFEASAEEVVRLIVENVDNAGVSDEDRARNYLIMRYGEVYAKCAAYHRDDYSLSAIDARPSPLSGARKIVDVIFTFTNRKTDVVEKQCASVDSTEALQFLVGKMRPYFDR